MSQPKILVIDDSATIRRLADSFLSPEGYHVVLAPTAEEGLALATEIRPDLVLLDHQLPGTTGFDVATQLSEDADLRTTPVVISSTLRKKAYVEYADLPNVVDMLPKPYTAELLTTTVKNALDTGAMVVASQSDGSAVPEVIDAPTDAALQGEFKWFTLRELLDFLNNTHKEGVLEVEGRTVRMSFFLKEGRVQGATASGLDPDELEASLPEELEPLAPVMRMTMAGGAGSQLDALVELLDRRVVDAKLLVKLLRHQASQLLMRSFKEPLHRFRFHADQPAPTIVGKLPLEVSTLALLVDGALCMSAEELPKWLEDHCFTRRVSRSHSLDRSGLSARHVKLAGLPSQPESLADLAKKHGFSVDEARRVLFGMSLGELVEVQAGASARHIVAAGLDEKTASRLRTSLEEAGGGESWALHVAPDAMALKLLLRRVRPAALVFSLDDPALARTVGVVCRQNASALSGAGLIGLGDPAAAAKLPLDDVLSAAPGDAAWKRLVQRCLHGDDAANDPGLPELSAEVTAKPPGMPTAKAKPAPVDAEPNDSEQIVGLETAALLARIQPNS